MLCAFPIFPRKDSQPWVRSRKLSQGLAYSRNASQCIVDWRVSWLEGWLMGPLQQGSKEARSMSELKDRLEGLLEALFVRILDNLHMPLLERWGRLPCAACGHGLDSNSVRLVHF